MMSNSYIKLMSQLSSTTTIAIAWYSTSIVDLAIVFRFLKLQLIRCFIISVAYPINIVKRHVYEVMSIYEREVYN